jgi:hypothetical protein
MPWRLQIAAQLYASGEYTPPIAMESADQLIAAHLATVPKCEHPKKRRAFTKHAAEPRQGEKIVFGQKTPAVYRHWCLDCGEEVTS